MAHLLRTSNGADRRSERSEDSLWGMTPFPTGAVAYGSGIPGVATIPAIFRIS
jgi:hypothetical protein